MLPETGDALGAAPAKTVISDILPDRASSILAIINAAAEVYRGVIPADRWREPYMETDALARELASGVAFCGVEVDGRLVGVMGVQSVQDVDLIRHAYVEPGSQGNGIGGVLLGYICGRTTRRILVGTWAAAAWAIAFYEKQGFRLVRGHQVAELLRAYWDIPERQIETSVVLELDRKHLTRMQTL